MTRLRNFLYALPGLVLLAYPFAVVAASAKLWATDVLEVRPSGDYRRWWSEMEKCTGVHRDLSTVRFFVVEGDEFRVNSAIVAVGFYEYVSGNIYVAQGDMFRRGTVAHEMVHALGFFGHAENGQMMFVQCGLE